MKATHPFPFRPYLSFVYCFIAGFKWAEHGIRGRGALGSG